MEHTDSLSFEKKLATGMDDLNRDEVFRLCLDICAALEFSAPAEGCHGGVWPGNISIAPDGTYVLGAALNKAPADMEPDALEYMAPETFREGERTPACDVYSLGLLMYAALNGGRPPFIPEFGEPGPAERADALRRRMKGETFPPPKNCEPELQSVIMKAVAADRQARFATPAELGRAVRGIFIPTPPTVPRYTVEKDFEPREPEKPARKKFPLIPALVVLAVAAALLLGMRSCSDSGDPEAGYTPPGGAGWQNPGVDLPSPTPESDPTETPEVTPAVTPDTPGGTEPDETPDVGVPDEPGPTAGEGGSETPTPTPGNPVGGVEIGANEQSLISGNYVMLLENCTWEQADERCRALGGHLATISDRADLDRVITMAETLGARYVWLGAKRETAGGDMVWVTGEDIDFYVWDINEPSYRDGYDGTREDYLMLWHVTFGDHNGWAYNDSRLDPVAASAKTYSGKIAYICEFDDIG